MYFSQVKSLSILFTLRPNETIWIYKDIFYTFNPLYIETIGEEIKYLKDLFTFNPLYIETFVLLRKK